MNVADTKATLDMLKVAQGIGGDTLYKAFTQPGSAVSGLSSYDLEAGAKSLFPVLTPFRNWIPRVSANGGIQANWRGITGINVNSISAGLGQGNRGGIVATSTQDYMAAYKTLGLDDYVTFQAEWTAEGFADVRAIATRNLLSALMIQEEKIIIGGNSSFGVAQPAAPTVSTATTGGAIAASGGGGYNVIVVALSYEGQLTASMAGGIQGLVTRVNADQSVDTYGGGSSIQSSPTNQVTTGATSTLSASTAAVPGAFGYAWYVGAPGAEKLQAITNLNSVLLTAALLTTTQPASGLSGNNSQNQLIFDGLLTFCSNSANNTYNYTAFTGTPGTGTPLTGDGVGGIIEIDAAFKNRWDNYRLSFDEIWVHSQEQHNINAKILAGTSSTAQRFVFNVDQGVIAGGTMVHSYLNKYSMAGAVEVPIKLHPNLPPGTILFITKTLPYPLSNVTNVLQIRTRREYWQVDWPLRSMKYEFGVYCDEVLQNYFPPAFGIITNLGNG